MICPKGFKHVPRGPLNSTTKDIIQANSVWVPGCSNPWALYATKKFNGKLQIVYYENLDYLDPIPHTNQPFDVKKQIFSSNTLSETNIANPKHGEMEQESVHSDMVYLLVSWFPGKSISRLPHCPRSKHLGIYGGISSLSTATSCCY